MKIILGSLSPRRRELLTILGHDVVVVDPNVTEIDGSSGLSPDRIALINAQNKANQVFQTCGLMDRDMILGADTVVVVKNRVFGKARDREDAFSMLRELSDGQHQVLTSYCLIGADHRHISRTISSSVEFRALLDSEIKSYLKSDEWEDKAGAYAVQGMGAALIRQVFGSITNVIGLPIDEVMADAQRLIVNS